MYIRKSTNLTFIFTLILSLLFAFPYNSYAAVANGSDPIATGCSKDAITVYTAPIINYDGDPVARAELRYSQSCRSAWGKVIVTKAWVGQIGGHIQRNDNVSYHCDILGGFDDIGETCYTAQVNDAGYTAKAGGSYIQDKHPTHPPNKLYWWTKWH